MLCEQLAQLTRQYTDEPTQDFMSNRELSGWLDQAYREFRAIVSQKDQNYLSRIHTVSPSLIVNGQLQLKGLLLPPNPTQPQMQRLTRVMYETTPGQFPIIIQPLGSLEQFKSSLWGSLPSSYFLDRGTGILWLTSRNNQGSNLQIQYIPEPQINWLTAIIPNANIALEDGLDDWHELIALLACRRYFIRDGVENKVIENMIKESKTSLYAYIGKSTSNSNGYIRHESSNPW